MLRWIDIIKFANNGNPTPDKRVEKTPEEWKELLTEEQFRITRLKETERAFSSELCSYFEPGRYACICCGTELFDAETKFKSGTGWPSFTQPIKENVVAYHKDSSIGMHRIEALCNTCDAHLGHVFQDGPKPSGLRYCMNAVSLKKVAVNEKKIDFGGGCFWCTEAIFQRINGVVKVESGYSGGTVVNPTYREVCSGTTGHAEMVEITYNPEEISFEDLLRIHLSTHNPTTVDRQGADRGSQYRSVIFYRTENEKQNAMKIIDEVQKSYSDMIVTQLQMFEHFYKAEDRHQDYYNQNQKAGYCELVISPKLKKFKNLYEDKLKMETIDIHEGEKGITFFSLKIDDREVGRMAVYITPGILRAGHTGVDLSQRQNGYGKKLVDAVVDYARKKDLKVIPDCGFVAMMFNKYPELYGDVRGTR